MTAHSALLVLLLSCLLHLIVCSTPSLPLSGPSQPCHPRECGAMPMLVMPCPDGTAAGYTCQRDTADGICKLVSPHCPPYSNRTDNSNNNNNSTSTPQPTAHYPVRSSLHRNPAVPTTTTSSLVSLPTQPFFNCSRRQCGVSIMPVLLTCPDGSHAYPLCAWSIRRQHCAYLDPSCNYPGWRTDPPASTSNSNTNAAVEWLASTDGVDDGTAQQMCESGGCVLPMYVKLCPGGGSVRPHCVWTTVNGTGLCLATNPACPTVPTAELRGSVVGTNATNSAVMRGVSFTVAGVVAMLSLLVV